ncbi:glycosyltransferase [Streptantibioticus cattleyicolor]|uniref:Rifampin glycosyltransferase n=1 Tax=Streptantibioticus cattleyicolor (strain ATCC 35852 / DSM 46488 / JCM 4925 / NBRC 14057 / NRRL 8057) TaxID=1003195 RepID=F8JLG1_STREN|nr:glycosyltransferase [Streptantibioticus cattleyicolor]AEW98324.1 rifampin glycosyltransferase [Streptantibioticus cattleyicolor NRRL 8057 = DSM 46488]CCB72617.1 Rifampin glycosyltransferase [Streptantibioticus cattleyicolor NRRL 8057 = DSM 46488]
MRVLLTSWGSRGDVEPLAGLAVALREMGAGVRVCAPPDEEFAELLARAGVPLVPLGPTVRSVVAGPRPPTAEDAFRLAPELVAARFTTLGTAARGCDALLATGLMPAGARDVAEKLGIPYVLACFHTLGLPSQNVPPGSRPGRRSAPGETDNRVLWEQDAQRVNGLYREALNSHRTAIGLPPVDNVRDHVLTGRPWLAADATLCPSRGMTDLDVVQTGAWILPDDRPLPAGLAAFLDAGAPPVYVGFGSMAAHAPEGIARVAVEACRALGRRVVLARGWAGLSPVDDGDDCFVVGEVNQQALFRRVAAVVHHGGAGTTTTAARAGAPQVVVPRIADQPYWASRAAELGIGAAHYDRTPTVGSLSAALATALTDETRARAKAVAGTIRPDGAMVAAKLLLDAAGRNAG